MAEDVYWNDWSGGQSNMVNMGGEDTFGAVIKGNKYAMKELEHKLTSQLNDLVVMVRQNLDSITRKKSILCLLLMYMLEILLTRLYVNRC